MSTSNHDRSTAAPMRDTPLSGGVAQTPRAADLRLVLGQLQGAITFLEEMLDEDYPGWDQPQGRGRRRVVGGGTAPRYAYGQLCTAWINCASMLFAEPGVAAWSIEPLVSRSLTTSGEQTVWELNSAGGLEISHMDLVVKVNGRDIPDGVHLSPVRDVEPVYTLARAQEILAGCTQHEWVVWTDEQGQPLGVRCAHRYCDERRSVVN